MISVIVPAYNAEKVIRKCIDSLLMQTYRDIEIIIVDDGSTDKTGEIIREYQTCCELIRVISHERNEGLFAARITGVAASKGDYISFIDSDDYISTDYLRLLKKKADETDADMIIADFFLDYPDGTRKFFNLDPIRNQELNLTEDRIMDCFMQQRGLFFGWQLVWNKLYKAEIWKKNIEIFRVFSRQHPKLNMTEDLAFSVVLWMTAHRVVNVHNAIYYYSQSQDQMTVINKDNEKKNIEKLQDVYSVFAFFRHRLENANLWRKYHEEYYAWKRNYGYLYLKKFDYKSKVRNIIYSRFLDYEVDAEDAGTADYFYSLSTEVSTLWESLEQIKRTISNPEIKVISFDVFDTCILRPFWDPTDLFTYMNTYFAQCTRIKSAVDFTDIRTESERCARKKVDFSREDITLEDIYAEMVHKYCLEPNVCMKLKNKETELEVYFAKARNMGKELYELAIDCKKRVIFTSDMYLDVNTISQILKKNGFAKYEKIYVSSEVGKTKYTGNLYKYVLNELDIKPSELMHIGDNWKSDYEMPTSMKIKSFHIFKAKDLFCGDCVDVYSGNYWKANIKESKTNRDLNYAIDGFLGYRTMMAMAANKIFDNPYISYNDNSDFNASPLHIGYFVLGTYLYSITQWLIECTSSMKKNSVHFAARDGFLVQEAYEIFRQIMKLPNSNYLYVSRKALVLANVREKVDLLSLIDNFNIFNYSPAKFMCFFHDIMNEEDKERFISEVKGNGFEIEKKFESREEYEDFLKLFSDECWDKVDWEKYRTRIHDYLVNAVSEGDVFFDIGYSGRVECALKNVLGYAMDSYYVHNNSEIVRRREKIAGFKNTVLFDYKPNITGVIREHVFMKDAPSTVGYEYNADGHVEPVFEAFEINYPMHFITDLIQQRALEFINDMIVTFRESIFELFYRYEDATQAFEYYLHNGTYFDRSIFSKINFEDDFGMGKRINALDFWSNEITRVNNGQIENWGVISHSTTAYQTYVDEGIIKQAVWKKALYWLKNDKKFFMRRILQYISGNRYNYLDNENHRQKS